MRIGIDLQVLAQKHLTGVAKYALNISKALLELKTNHEFVFFVPATSPSIPPLVRGGRFVVLPKKTMPFFTAHWTYARIMQKAKLDALFGPANVLPWFYSGRGVITIHDLAIYKHPEWFPRSQWFAIKYLVPRSISQASHIIVPSKATAKDLKGLFRIPEDKISIVPHGVEERFFTPSLNLSPLVGEGRERGKYILFVGTLEPRKNLERLIEAHQLLPEDIRQEYDLVLAGEGGLESEKLKAKSGKLGDRIRFLGYVPDQDLPALYQGAAVFVYPSLYEGFGMPVLEAMAAGVPVITSRGTAMEEVAGRKSVIPATEPGSSLDSRFRGKGNEGAVLVDPYSASEISQAVLTLIRDEAYSSQISKSGQELARKFTRERAAREMLEVFQRAISNF